MPEVKGITSCPERFPYPDAFVTTYFSQFTNLPTRFCLPKYPTPLNSGTQNRRPKALAAGWERTYAALLRGGTHLQGEGGTAPASLRKPPGSSTALLFPASRAERDAQGQNCPEPLIRSGPGGAPRVPWQLRQGRDF